MRQETSKPVAGGHSAEERPERKGKKLKKKKKSEAVNAIGPDLKESEELVGGWSEGE